MVDLLLGDDLLRSVKIMFRVHMGTIRQLCNNLAI
jgi:hypothetical protein